MRLSRWTLQAEGGEMLGTSGTLFIEDRSDLPPAEPIGWGAELHPLEPAVVARIGQQLRDGRECRFACVGPDGLRFSGSVQIREVRDDCARLVGCGALEGAGALMAGPGLTAFEVSAWSAKITRFAVQRASHPVWAAACREAEAALGVLWWLMWRSEMGAAENKTETQQVG